MPAESPSPVPPPSHHLRPAPRRRRAVGALVAVVVAAVGSLAPLAAPAPVGAQERGGPEVPYATTSDQAAAWLVAQFDADKDAWWAADHADFIFALAATNGSRTKAIESFELMESATPIYVEPAEGWFNYGGIAKVMLATQTIGADVHDVGGYDLEALLRGAIVGDGPDAGRVGDASTFTQPLAIMALARTPGGAPAATGAWLANKQCPDGGFSWGSCDVADADHTGIAAGALAAAGRTADRDEALDWLEAHQADDGGLFASSSPGDSNTNSTGLAVQALRAAGRDAAVLDAGAEYVASAQIASGDDAGAIRWKPDMAGSLFLATTQGVLAWGAPLYSELSFPEVVGEPCPPAEGVTVVVDLAHFDDTIRIGCAPGPQVSGATAMEGAGFAIGWHPDYPGGGGGLGGAVCQLEGHPAAGFPECWFVGFWSYWHARADAQWVFSNCGIDNRTPRQGSVEGWRYEPDVNNHWAAPPLVDARFPRVTVDAPAELVPGATATITATVERTEARTSPAPGEDPEPCYLPPETGPENHEPTVAGPVTDGLVEVRVDGVAVGAPVAVGEDGTVEVDATLAAGEHEVTAHFLGTATDLPAPSTGVDVLVAPATTTTVDVDPDEVARGAEVVVAATVTTTDGGAPVPSGEVELRADGEPLGDPVALSTDGTAELVTSFDEVGEVAVTAHHLGSLAGLPSASTPVTLTVIDGDTPSEAVVRDLYDAVLGRGPDPGGLAYWAARLDAGERPERVAESLARSREAWSQVVRQHYRLALSREGDPGGIEHWTDVVRTSNRPDTLLTTLFASTEVFTIRGGGTNAGYVTYVYDRVLHRAPDPGGLAYWVDRIGRTPGPASAGRREAARSLVVQAESISRQVDAHHVAVCGVPTPAAAKPDLTARFEASHLNPSTLRAAIVIRGCPP